MVSAFSASRISLLPLPGLQTGANGFAISAPFTLGKRLRGYLRGRLPALGERESVLDSHLAHPILLPPGPPHWLRTDDLGSWLDAAASCSVILRARGVRS